MKNILNLIIFFSFLTLQAQVGIGTTHPRAALDISNSAMGGVLVPKFALTGRNDITTVLNPTGGALEIGTLIYNTANSTGANYIQEGFVYWNGTFWEKIVPKTEIMMRVFNANGIGGTNTTFNYPNSLFNNIAGSSFAGTNIILPTGLYLVESNLRLNSNNTIDWRPRLNGALITSTVVGSANPTAFATNASTVQSVAVVEVTGATANLDFVVTGGSGAKVIPGQCYVLVKKLN